MTLNAPFVVAIATTDESNGRNHDQENPMAFDERLAQRIREMLIRRRGIEEKKMFGGVGFLLNGNMCVGVWKEWLIVRLGPTRAHDALAQPFVKEFDITGRAMKGWAMVAPEGLEDDDDLRDWIQGASKFVGTLPPKK